MLNIDLQQMLQEYDDYMEVGFEGIDPRIITSVSRQNHIGLSKLPFDIIVLKGKWPADYGIEI